MSSHVVKSGDTLTGIASKYLGSASKWTKVRDANPCLPQENQLQTVLL